MAGVESTLTTPECTCRRKFSIYRKDKGEKENMRDIEVQIETWRQRDNKRHRKGRNGTCY
jgi:hypothetical protein